jgi:hypothetical protein
LSYTKGETIYTPPSGEAVIREKLADLEKFINQDNTFDPLIKMALLHYQFEAIHPFADGRGLAQLKEITALMEATAEHIKTKLPGIYSKDLIEILFRLPYTKRKFLIDAGIGSPKTAGNYLMSLENNGFLKSIRVGKEKLYLNHTLMEVLKRQAE